MLDIVWRDANVSTIVDSIHATLLYKMSWMFGGLRSEAGFDRSHGTLNGTRMAQRLGLQKKPISSTLNVALA